MHMGHALTELGVLDVAKAGLYAPAPGIEIDNLSPLCLGVADRQTPGLLHVLLLDTDDHGQEIALQDPI